MRDFIKKLSDARGVSGFEYRMSDIIKERLTPVADEIHTDILGNIIAVKRSGSENAKSIMIEAHMDEVGLMVLDTDENGFILFTNIGGIDLRTLPSAEVTVHGKKDVWGVVGAKPPHLQSAGEDKKGIKITDLSIDTGLTAEEVKKLVSVGDSITINSEFSELGSLICGKSLDDRVGAAAVCDVFERLGRINLDLDVYAVFAVQEEVGSRGAKVSANALKPDMAIVIDVTHGLTPDNPDNGFKTGSGVAVAKGPNINPELFDKVTETAKRYNIKTELEIEGGDTGTDAWVTQTAAGGIPTVLLSVPLKYMHTSVETMDIKDLYALSNLITLFIQDYAGLYRLDRLGDFRVGQRPLR
ncbi:MAG: M20/M25/M40 family metallo-hydrolase [Oscillospiraceae bacterium]|nr:M20/M25/M40 family metallo-hydrolase [Oscillospiraceae bacterium]